MALMIIHMDTVPILVVPTIMVTIIMATVIMVAIMIMILTDTAGDYRPS